MDSDGYQKAAIMKQKTFIEEETEKCFYDNSCALPQMLFRIQTETDSAPPFACLNDIKLFDTISIERGINVAVLNGTTGDILHRQTFDVRASDEKLMRWMTNLPDASIIVAASFGDVAEHVSRQARQIFSAFGALKIDKWRGGSAYAIIGQRGIDKGEAHETISKFNENSEKLYEGCFELPIATTKKVNLSIDGPHVHRADETKLAELGAVEGEKKEVITGETWPNCGIEKQCPEDTIAVHFFSGEHKDDHPKICIGGKMLIDKNLNKAGRGLNMAMLEPKTGRVTAVAHFDTYEDESTALEEWLDAIPTGSIVAVVSFDEASTMLSEMARRIFYEMGSSMIDRLKFRASWFFVGQKGIGAYSPFEDMNIPTGNSWATPVKSSFCLPKSVYKWAGRRDDATTTDGRNLPKRHFCAKYDRHEEFCSVDNLDTPIVPRLLHDEKRANDGIFNIPILVASGLAPDSLRSTLQSLINQEGINTQMVLVTYDKEYSENADLATLYHVKSVAITSNGSYNALLLSTLSNGFSIFPEAQSVIIIEEDTVVDDNWLHYLSSIYPSFNSDKTVDIAMAFNPNGFEDISGDDSTVYRIKGALPIGSYLLKRDLYEKHIRLREFCCTERYNWDLRDCTVLVPDVSRVEIRVDELEKTNMLFSRKRVSTNKQSTLKQDYSTESTYEEYITDQFQNATITHANEVISVGCSKWKLSVSQDSLSVVIKYTDIKELESLLICIQYYYTPRILRSNQVFRFSLHQSTEVFIVPLSMIV